MPNQAWCSICGPCPHQLREIQLANEAVEPKQKTGGPHAMLDLENGFEVARRIASWLPPADKTRAMSQIERAEKRYTEQTKAAKTMEQVRHAKS